MVKKLLIALGILLGIIVLLGAISIYFFKPSESDVVDFIKNNPRKSAIKLVRNDTILADLNSERIMPLASTVKIIIAIEYALQSASAIIDPDEQVTFDALDKYYVANTDGGAHPDWLNSIKNKVNDNRVSIREVAKGMINYSSNANTEWLCHKLGLEKINARIDSLGISDHTVIYNIVSALFVGKERFPNLSGKELEKKLMGLSLEEYISITNSIHHKLLSDPTYKTDVGDLSMNIQRVWSDNLPGSTVGEYAELMRKLNSKTYFNSETYSYLDEVMEGIMERPTYQKRLAFAGMKGGSTAFVLTKALYATDKQGNKTELAYFFNDLGVIDNLMLQESMDEFELKVLTDKDFLNEIKMGLKN